MPKSRKADYHLGCLDGDVFIDFDCLRNSRITLVRISFDEHGCCNLGEQTKPLNCEDSQEFIAELNQESLNQQTIEKLIKKAIRINKEHIWPDAIEEYGLIEP